MMQSEAINEISFLQRLDIRSLPSDNILFTDVKIWSNQAGSSFHFATVSDLYVYPFGSRAVNKQLADGCRAEALR
jgi:hypothetical protein